jgi:hypothetical protein
MFRNDIFPVPYCSICSAMTPDVFSAWGSSSMTTAMSWPLTICDRVLPRAMICNWFQLPGLMTLFIASRSPMVPMARGRSPGVIRTT